MNIESALEANAQFAETGKPGMRAFDDPSMSPQPLAAFHPTAGDASLDAALLQITPATCEVIALVRMQLARTFAGLAAHARHCRDGIQRGFECHRVVTVGARDRDDQGNAMCIYDDVPFRPELPPIGRVGAGFLAPAGWKHWRRQGSRVPNQSGRAHATDGASPNVGAPTHLRPASLVGVASMSCRCRNRAPAASLPMEYRFAGHTECR